MAYSEEQLKKLKKFVTDAEDELNELIKKSREKGGLNMAEMGQVNNFFLGALHARMIYLEAFLVNLQERLDCLFPKTPL